MSQRFGPYHVGETIGRGTFGKVKMAVHESTQMKVALKIIPRKVMEQDPRSNVKITREITILRVLNHPNIMRLYDVVQTTNDIVLVLEYVSGGELFDYICRKGRLTEDVARYIFQQIVAGVAYCHRYRVAHRDIKPENIMMEQGSTRIKIGDFGLSSVSRDGRFFETSCGTPNYASPEVVSGRLYGGPETDVWSCGVVLYTMVVGVLPFDDSNVGSLFKKIQTANYSMPSYLSDHIKDLLTRILVVNPLERATMEQIMRHPWVIPAFPPHLLTIHYDTILDSVTFGKTTLQLDETLDEEIIKRLAAHFNMSVPEIAAIIAIQEKHRPSLFSSDANIPGKKNRCKRYPALEYFEKSANVVDAKLWPSPLIIPPAERALRDREHDLHVSYNILLHKKQSHFSQQNISKFGTRSDAASSFVLTLSTSQGYGSLNANTLQQVSFGVSNASRSFQQGYPKGASHDTIRMNKEGGITFCGSLPADVQSEQPASEEVDVYMKGYNRVVEIVIPLASASSTHTLLGKLLGVVERPLAVSKPSPSHSQTPLKLSNSTHAGSGKGGALLQPLLKPMANNPDISNSASVDGRTLLRPSLANAGRKGKANYDDKVSLSGGKSGIPFSTDMMVNVLHCEAVSRFGNDFIRNGILFYNSNCSTTLQYVYSAMEEEGFLWKVIQPFAFAAVIHPFVKLQLRIYKVTAEERIVDLKISAQSGMYAFDKAVKLLERLRKKATSHNEKKLKKSLDIRQQDLTSSFRSTSKGTSAAPR